MWKLKPPRIEGLFLGSRVGRRVFFMFVLSAAIPAILLAALTYEHLRSMDQEYLRTQLSHESGQYARALYERLLGAQFSLGVQAAGLRRGIGPREEGRTPARNMSPRVHRRLFRLDQDGTYLLAGPPTKRMPLPVSQDLRRYLLRGESVLLTQYDAQGSRVLMATAIDPAHPDEGDLIAELDPEYLWGDEEDFSDQMATCVREGQRVLFCSERRLMAVAQGLPNGAGNRGGWQYDTRGLFLRAKFGLDDWTIITLRKRDVGDAGGVQLGYIFLGVIVFMLLLVAFLSVLQIRRTLVPLEQLIAGTRRIANKEFDQPVTVGSDDEFGQLATAFNNMAGRIGRQIGTLRALSEIDQEILSRVELAQIIDGVQQRLQQIWPHAATSMVVFDPQAADFGIVHLHAGADGVTAKLPTRLEPWLLDRVARAYDGMWFDVGGAELPDFLSLLVGAGAMRILVLPIYWQDKVNGLLSIGLTEKADFNEDQIQQARDLGNRIGVALAANARDEELKYRAFHDGLTDLPNRSLLVERMSQEMAHARRDGNQLAVLFMDLDRFKHINDSLGHESGDRLLCQVADRLTSCTREGDTVARLGGDEFVVLLPRLQKAEQAARLATEMMSLLSEPYLLNGHEYYIGVSVGVAVFPADGVLAHELLKKADMAMYRAKAMGRGQIVFFEEGMNIAQQERALLERELRQAMARGQMHIHYQPRFKLANGELVGAEALIRWEHPKLGSVLPEKFIPLAEEIGLIDELGAWVLKGVCEQLAKWHEAGYRIDISVNVSARQLQSGQLGRRVRDILAATGANPHMLELEVTESMLFEDIEALRKQLNQVKQTGVQVALDDFGIGYSSLTYLQRLPLDIVKIDRSFVGELGRSEEAASIVYSIITLAHAMGKTTVAEGVESQEQEALLRNWGCEQAQGYYYSVPLSASALEEMMSPTQPEEAR